MFRVGISTGDIPAASGPLQSSIGFSQTAYLKIRGQFFADFTSHARRLSGRDIVNIHTDGLAEVLSPRVVLSDVHCCGLPTPEQPNHTSHLLF